MALFNTLTYARKLEAAGVPAQQAEIQSNTLAQVIEGVMVTKLDLDNLDRKVTSELRSLGEKLNSKIDTEFAPLRPEVSNNERSIRSDMRAMEQRLDTKIDGLENRLLIKLGSVMVGVGGMIVAAFAIIAK